MYYSFKFPHDKMNVNNIETQKISIKIFIFTHKYLFNKGEKSKVQEI
jgi:hypothetical protein